MLSLTTFPSFLVTLVTVVTTGFALAQVFGWFWRRFSPASMTALRHGGKQPLHFFVDRRMIAPGGAEPSADMTPEPQEVSRVAIWNGGNASITKDQISSTFPLVLSVDPPDAVRTVSRVALSSYGSNARLKSKRRGAFFEVRFDYLEPGDGAVFEIVHDPGASLSLLGYARDVRPDEVRAPGATISDHYLAWCERKRFALRFAFADLGRSLFRASIFPLVAAFGLFIGLYLAFPLPELDETRPLVIQQSVIDMAKVELFVGEVGSLLFYPALAAFALRWWLNPRIPAGIPLGLHTVQMAPPLNTLPKKHDLRPWTRDWVRFTRFLMRVTTTGRRAPRPGPRTD